MHDECRALLIVDSGGSRNFRNGAHGPGAVEFIGSGDCFYAPSHIPYVFVVREEHFVNITC